MSRPSAHDIVVQSPPVSLRCVGSQAHVTSVASVPKALRLRAQRWHQRVAEACILFADALCSDTINGDFVESFSFSVRSRTADQFVIYGWTCANPLQNICIRTDCNHRSCEEECRVYMIAYLQSGFAPGSMANVSTCRRSMYETNKCPLDHDWFDCVRVALHDADPYTIRCDIVKVAHEPGSSGARAAQAAFRRAQERYMCNYTDDNGANVDWFRRNLLQWQ